MESLTRESSKQNPGTNDVLTAKPLGSAREAKDFRRRW